ncbi:MAG: hypothetical protein K0R82_1615 [Flavipsychrobacter sp.]|nr:hypothetical protein [Flavipsychrobacter sp.]
MNINRLMEDLDRLDFQLEPHLIGLRLIILNAINELNRHRPSSPQYCSRLIRTLQDIYKQIPPTSNDCDVHEFNVLKAQVYDSLGQASHMAA